MNNTDVRIHETIPINGAGKVIIQAFTGSGLVSSLVSYHLIDKFGLMEKGYVKSSMIPAVGIVRNGVIQRPVRIFENENFILVLSEVGIPSEDLDEFVEGLFDWYMEIDPSSIIVIGALPTGRPVEAIDLKYSLVSSDELTKAFLEEKGLKISNRSAVYGSVALSLMEASKCNISAMCVLPHCIASIPDYLAAKKSVEILSVILDKEISVSPLDSNARELKEHLIRRKKHKKSKQGINDEELEDFDEFVTDMLGMDTDDEDDEDLDLSRFK